MTERTAGGFGPAAPPTKSSLPVQAAERPLPHFLAIKLAFATVVLASGLMNVAAAAPTPSPDSNNARLNQKLKAHLPSGLPTPRIPSIAQHVDFLVETNAKGQVTRVRSGTESKDAAFNAMVYGNALQTFIRTKDGDAVAGTYKLSYDYSPKTKAVKRSVELVRAGGVDPNARGAVDDLADINRKRAEREKASPSPTAK